MGTGERPDWRLEDASQGESQTSLEEEGRNTILSFAQEVF